MTKNKLKKLIIVYPIYILSGILGNLIIDGIEFITVNKLDNILNFSPKYGVPITIFESYFLWIWIGIIPAFTTISLIDRQLKMTTFPTRVILSVFSFILFSFIWINIKI